MFAVGLRAAARGERFCYRLLGAAAAAVLLLLVFVTAADVCGRYFFSAPLPGATELTEFAVAIAVFAALPGITRDGGHIAVDLLDKILPAWFHRARDVAVNLFAAFALTALGGRIWGLANRAAARGEVSEYLSLPQDWIVRYIALMTFCAAFAAFVAAALSAAMRGDQKQSGRSPAADSAEEEKPV
jgi:TRAP-type C4-dicarboxylate transport system permease small subunit